MYEEETKWIKLVFVYRLGFCPQLFLYHLYIFSGYCFIDMSEGAGFTDILDLSVLFRPILVFYFLTFFVCKFVSYS